MTSPHPALGIDYGEARIGIAGGRSRGIGLIPILFKIARFNNPTRHPRERGGPANETKEE